MPPDTVPLGPRSIIDLSHESLMRGWTRLVDWAEQDRRSSSLYMRLSQAARWHAEGTAGLCRNPELELGLRWKRDNRPTPAWGRRHDDWFDRTMAFLDQSEQEYIRAKAERDQERKRKLRQARWTAAVFGVLFLVAGLLAYVARQENRRATVNLGLAKDAVDQSLSSAGLDPASATADVPQMAEFRRELLEKAKVFYVDFLKQDARDETLRHEMAQAHLRVGHIDRWLDRVDDAAHEYEQAIGLFESLGNQSDKPEYRQDRASACSWLGLTLSVVPAATPMRKKRATARSLQEDLMRADPPREGTSKTRHERGTARHPPLQDADHGSAEFSATESDFREAIRLLQPLAGRPGDPVPSVELARAQQPRDTGGVGYSRLPEARGLYEAAIRRDEDL
jgi:tetratricopeptide (TPR) repeat protein